MIQKLQHVLPLTTVDRTSTNEEDVEFIDTIGTEDDTPVIHVISQPSTYNTDQINSKLSTEEINT